MIHGPIVKVVRHVSSTKLGKYNMTKNHVSLKTLRRSRQDVPGKGSTSNFGHNRLKDGPQTKHLKVFITFLTVYTIKYKTERNSYTVNNVSLQIENFETLSIGR